MSASKSQNGDRGSENDRRSSLQFFGLSLAAQCVTRKPQQKNRKKTRAGSVEREIRAPRSSLRGAVRSAERERVPAQLEAR